MGLGTSESDHPVLLPRIVEDFSAERIVDISLGDVHCLALSQDCTVYAWGMNSMGHCGLGHTNSPICSPQKVKALDGVPIHQISAGTSHSMAWTALPSDRCEEEKKKKTF